MTVEIGNKLAESGNGKMFSRFLKKKSLKIFHWSYKTCHRFEYSWLSQCHIIND